MATYSVVVGNIGVVVETNNSEYAYEVYASYKMLSEKGQGRVAGERVTLMNNETGDIEAEYEKPKTTVRSRQKAVSARLK